MDEFSIYHIPYSDIDWNSIQPTFFQAKNSTNTAARSECSMLDSKDENSRPVSAYAIFFRERQVLVKKSNPQATFGDISRIVAAQWDSLAIHEKLRYKRRSDQLRNKHIRLAVKERVQRICTDLMSSSSVTVVDSTMMISKQGEAFRMTRSSAGRQSS
ncbi:hypothetical protein KIN20_030895 [Parelaphostrongylus tenuis]|uniref:HMG box domain-containing protein n=1 Tax=Parelaphostrongylus tenuis TaxID=148309 RepID=A0AAD5R4U9_PARTN|nr:hypothetical protein KIN20_030895 [Parelaphostrongylus tenuis]